ncbi:MAG: SUMF1/EgtB/PvdO family nonheme iron enzyme [Alphaproteobacteria bacterium]|nr:SUMF1/EgtB/PvdO family nonheme iron enzyme [Alphaproteobacteria bacterium]
MREPVTPRGRYEAVGKEGKLAAIVSGVVAVVVVIGVIIGVIVMRDDDEPAADQSKPASAAASPAAAKPAAAQDQAPDELATRDCKNCPVMVTIPAGAFTMGLRTQEADLDDISLTQQQTELPLHGVTIKEVFALGRTEVTRGEFAMFVNETGYQALGCVVSRGGTWVLDRSKSWRDPGFEQDDDHPVVCVDYEDAKAYVDWLSRRTGKRYRLPTETEWEYAARAGSNDTHPWGDKPALACTYGNMAGRSYAAKFDPQDGLVFPCDSGFAFTAPVGRFQPNEFGLYDMYGNARELVADCWNPTYWGQGLGAEARMTGSCGLQVLRGGGWDDAPANVRPARRFHDERTERRADQGFRVAKDLPLAGTTE